MGNEHATQRGLPITPARPARVAPPGDRSAAAPRLALVVLGLAALAVPRLAFGDPVEAITLLTVAVCATALLAKLEWSLTALVIASPFERYVATYVSPSAVKLLGIAVFAGFTLRVLTGNERRFPRHAGLALLATFVLLAMVATTANPNGGDGLATLIRYVSFAMLCLTATSVLTNGRALDRLLGWFVVACTASSVAGLWTFLTGVTARADGPLDDPNDLAFFLAVAVPLAGALAARSRGPARLTWGGCVLVLVAGVAFTLSRGASLALLVLVCWGLARRVLPLKATLAAAVGAALLVGGVVLIAPQLAQTALEQKTYIAGRNVDTRTLRWNAAASMAVDHPLAGVGPSGFRLNYASYATEAHPDDASDVVAHQMYLEIAAELGLPALAVFLLLLAVGWRACHRAVRRPDRAPPGDVTLALGVQGALLVVMVAALFLTEQYYLPLWFLLAAAFALQLRTEGEA